MKIIVCLDDRNGMLFNNRRQSSDRLLRERVLQLAGGARLWMNTYSAKQFADSSETVCVDEDFLSRAGVGEYCFVENVDCSPYIQSAEAIIVYHWNTVYPSDTWFPTDHLEGETPVSVFEFAGYSHKKITEEIYEL